MGTDAHGILFYGSPLPEFDTELDYYDMNKRWEVLYAPTRPTDTSDYRTPEWDAWRRALDEWRKSCQNIEIAFSGSDGCSEYYVHLAGLKLMVEWSEQLDITGKLDVPQDAQQKLDEFCDMFALPRVKPAWHLASLYF